ncbi:MAG: hypothetical protein HND58_18615 [Planctomycetota bacterium]|nr:MAG: hypothetical protein HND58_18615 [Planctomycetota bacterium]
MTGANEAQQPHNPSASHWRGPGLLALALAASLLVVSLLGSSLSPIVALGSLVLKLGSLWPGLVYLLAACGLAWPLRRLWKDSPDSVPVQLAVGVAIMVSLSHLLGVFGLLNGVTAIGSCVVGIGLLLAQIARASRPGTTPARLGPGQIVIAALAMPAAAVLVVAALMPPGWLWGSEYGGFDALSYHLQLPQEWLASGRITPVEHNVYSYLPGYIESAFTHLGALTLAPLDRGLVAGDGWRLLACQGLHAGLVVATAWITARNDAPRPAGRHHRTDCPLVRRCGRVPHPRDALGRGHRFAGLQRGGRERDAGRRAAGVRAGADVACFTWSARRPARGRRLRLQADRDVLCRCPGGAAAHRRDAARAQDARARSRCGRGRRAGHACAVAGPQRPPRRQPGFPVRQRPARLGPLDRRAARPLPEPPTLSTARSPTASARCSGRARPPPRALLPWNGSGGWPTRNGGCCRC